jgi:cytoskeleton protein RodZ
MSEDSRESSEARSAGAMLRAARERQGLHIAALAASIKVPPAKLEALEAGRYEALTDSTFVRALAQSVCRVLKIDAKPVLELLPGPRGGVLDRVDDSSWSRFQEPPGRHVPTEVRIWHQPVFWVVLVLLVAAAAFLLWPQRASLPASVRSLFGASSPPADDAPVVAAGTAAPASRSVAAGGTEIGKPTTAESTSAIPIATPASTMVTTEATPAVPAEPAPNLAADTASGLAVVRAREPSWVEAHDARGAVLLSRTLQAGESVGLDGPVPLHLVIGNAQATEVLLRGKRVALGAPNRDNVVKVDLK